MNWMDALFGHGRDLDALQMSCRAVVIFVIALLLLRIAGIRTIGKKSAFDQVIIIMLGAILSRPVVGASAFLPAVISSLTFVLVQAKSKYEKNTGDATRHGRSAQTKYGGRNL